VSQIRVYIYIKFVCIYIYIYIYISNSYIYIYIYIYIKSVKLWQHHITYHTSTVFLCAEKLISELLQVESPTEIEPVISWK